MLFVGASQIETTQTAIKNKIGTQILANSSTEYYMAKQQKNYTHTQQHTWVSFYKCCAIQSEISPKEKNKYHILMHIYEI